MNKFTVAPFTQQQLKETLEAAGTDDADPHKIQHSVDLYLSECATLERDLMKKIVKNNYILGILPNFAKYRRTLEMQALMIAEKKNNLYVWLTINPAGAPHNWNKPFFLKFKKKVESFVKRKMFKGAIWVFEQRVPMLPSSTTASVGLGYHAHLLLIRNPHYKPYDVFRWSKQSFEKYCNVNDSNLFNFHWTPQEYVKDKVEYMTMGKLDDSPETLAMKRAKQKGDIHWRQTWSLNQFYTHLPSTLAEQLLITIPPTPEEIEAES